MMGYIYNIDTMDVHAVLISNDQRKIRQQFAA
jgi:hypothetical protein